MLRKIEKTHEDHVYFNVSIAANTDGQPAKYRVNLTDPILTGNVSEDYHLVITRFNMPVSVLPFIIFRIQEGIFQNNPNLGSYIFSFVYNNDIFSRPVIYNLRPDEIPPLPPSLNNGKQSFLSYGYQQLYYYIYHIDAMIILFNETLNTIKDDLLLAYPLLAPLESPYLKYDNNTKLITLIYPLKFITENIKIFYNQPIEKFLEANTIKFEFTEPRNPILYNEFLLEIKPQYENAYYPPTVIPMIPPIFLQSNPQWSTLSSIAEVKSIVFTTTSIPVRSEITTKVQDNNYIDDPIITDFLITEWDGSRSDITFIENGVYRFIDILGHSEIRNLDLQIFWVDSLGERRPYIHFTNNDPITMKLAFIRDTLVS